MRKLLFFSTCLIVLLGCETNDETNEIIADFAINVEYSSDYSSATVIITDASLNVPYEEGAYYDLESAFTSRLGQYRSGWTHEGEISKNGHYDIILTINHKYQKIRGIDITLLQ
jgi:hypothetical protein